MESSSLTHTFPSAHSTSCAATKSSAYLVRSRHGIWYFRIVVPPYAQERVGKKVIKRSLKTRSKREAILKASDLLLEATALIGRCSSSGSQDKPFSTYGTQVVHVEDTPMLRGAALRDDSPQRLPKSDDRISLCLPAHHASKPLSVVAESYRQQQKLEGVSIKTLDDKQAVVDLLIRIIGDLPITKYTIESVEKFGGLNDQVQHVTHQVPCCHELLLSPPYC